MKAKAKRAREEHWILWDPEAAAAGRFPLAIYRREVPRKARKR